MINIILWTMYDKYKYELLVLILLLFPIKLCIFYSKHKFQHPFNFYLNSSELILCGQFSS